MINNRQTLIKTKPISFRFKRNLTKELFNFPKMAFKIKKFYPSFRNIILLRWWNKSKRWWFKQMRKKKAYCWLKVPKLKQLSITNSLIKFKALLAKKLISLRNSSLKMKSWSNGTTVKLIFISFMRQLSCGHSSS